MGTRAWMLLWASWAAAACGHEVGAPPASSHSSRLPATQQQQASDRLATTGDRPGQAGGEAGASDARTSQALWDGEIEVCSYVSDERRVLDLDPAAPALAVAARGADMALVWQREGGQFGLERWTAPGTVQSSALFSLADDAPDGVAAMVESPVIMAHERGWLLGWVERQRGSRALRAQVLSTGGEPDRAAGFEVTQRGVDGAWTLAASRSGRGYTRALALWQAASGSGAPEWRAAEVGHGGPSVPGANKAEVASTGGAVSLLALERSWLAGWRQPQGPDGKGGSVFAQPLDVEGRPTGPAVRVSRHAVATGSVAMADQLDEAAMVFDAQVGGIRSSVTFQRIDAQGTPRGPALPIEPAPFETSDASVAPFGRGYVVAYRSRVSRFVEQPSVRLAFVDRHGQVVYRVELTGLEATGPDDGGLADAEGRPALATDATGRVLVAWETRAASGRRAVAQRFACAPALDLCLR